MATPYPTVDPAPDKPKVLCLAGAHRSGTTMLTSALGGYEGYSRARPPALLHAL